MSNGTHNGDWAGCDGSGYGFLIEFPKVFQAAASTSNYNHIEGRQAAGRWIAKQSDGLGDFGGCAFSLNAHGTDDDFDASLAAVQDMKEVLDGRAGGRCDDADAAGEFG
jgi:hypothetical protein